MYTYRYTYAPMYVYTSVIVCGIISRLYILDFNCGILKDTNNKLARREENLTSLYKLCYVVNKGKGSTQSKKYE